MAITMTVAQELAVARTRIDTLERILEKNGLLDRRTIEHFEPTKEEAAERGLWFQEYITRVLRIVQQESEAIGTAANGELASEDVAVELARDGDG